MKQQGFFQTKMKREHGGRISEGKRRGRRPLNSRLSLHITLKSHHALGRRSLFRHKKMILVVMKKTARHFEVKVYNYAICGNHLHLLLKGHDRRSLQNFFRVFAGHTAQNILALHPLQARAGGAPEKAKGCAKNQRKFWSFLLYSRQVSWGREFKKVSEYIERNVLELLKLVAYRRLPAKDTG
jgi:REP element-mobilizing transposase RayT